jgi:hypothetical protein
MQKGSKCDVVLGSLRPGLDTRVRESKVSATRQTRGADGLSGTGVWFTKPLCRCRGRYAARKDFTSRDPRHSKLMLAHHR